MLYPPLMPRRVIIITAGIITAQYTSITTVTALIMAGIATTAGGMGHITTAGTNSRTSRMPDGK